MDVNKINTVSPAPGFGISATASKSSGGNSSDSFSQHLGNEFKEEYKKRVADLFDEITEQADKVTERADMYEFEKYRQLIGKLLDEVVSNAYYMSSECVSDAHGRQRIFLTISIVDSKLSDLADSLIGGSVERLDYLSKMDEIRGLILDTLS